MIKRRAILAVVLVLISAFCAGVIVTKIRKPSRSTFHIAFNEWAGFAPFFLAKEKGYFGDLPVELHFIASESDKRAGLHNGRFQMICETMDMFQNGRSAVPYPGRIVFAVDESFGGDGVVAAKGIQSLKDLKGKVAVSEPGQASHLVLQYLLRKEGMTLKDVKLREMESSDAAAAFVAGKADVAATYEPYLGNALQKRAGSHLLVSSKDLPSLIVDVAVVSDKTLQTRASDVTRVYAGWCKAVEFLEKNRAEAIAVMAKPFRMTPKNFEGSAAGLRYFGRQRNTELFGSASTPGAIQETFKMIGEILLANGLTRAVDTPASKIDLSVVATPIP